MNISEPRIGTRKIYNFNQKWDYIPQDDASFSNRDIALDDWSKIHLPHTNTLLPHQDFSPSVYQFVSWYRKPFYVESDWKDKKVVVYFDGAMAVAQIFVNERFVGEHKGGYTSFSFDITNYLEYGCENLVAVRLDSTRRTDVPPEGNQVDYMLFGGIYRNAYLYVTDRLHIEDAFFCTVDIQGSRAILQGNVLVQNDDNRIGTGQVCVDIMDPHGNHSVTKIPYTLGPANSDTFILTIPIENPELWGVDHPVLYTIQVSLLDKENRDIDDLSFPFGIRTIGLADGHLLVNGSPIKLRGLNRHQMFPFIGNAAPKRLQRRDARILKHDLGLNYVRTSHYPQDPSFLDECDKLGLLVFTELPGWNHIGDTQWKTIAQQHIEEMIKRDRNHPSVFMWGVRINESADDHDFYLENNAIAHQLDPSRPTGGVRNFRDSECLEDVFTYNDFSMHVLPTVAKPQLITEFLGHMYPTKRTDPESRLLNQALYHASIVNEVYRREDIIGSSGWCAFDYNTHADFGPGSLVCYHGVMDMFRHPKFTAAFYASQKEPDQGIELSVATYFTFATTEHSELMKHYDLSTFDGNLNHETYHTPIYVFSNCDEVELKANGKSLGRKGPAMDEFPYLPHPPFRFEIHGYQTYGELQAIGYRNGTVVRTETISTPKGMSDIQVRTDDTVLIADGADLTRLDITAVDPNGMLCPYANRVVSVTVQGEGECIGENPIALEAGQISLYVRSTTQPGQITVTVHVQGFEDKVVTIQSVPCTEPRL